MLYRSSDRKNTDKHFIHGCRADCAPYARSLGMTLDEYAAYIMSVWDSLSEEEKDQLIDDSLNDTGN